MCARRRSSLSQLHTWGGYRFSFYLRSFFAYLRSIIYLLLYCGRSYRLSNFDHTTSLLVNADPLAVLGGVLELHKAVNHGEESVIPAHANVAARVELSATLPHEDRAWSYHLPIAALHAKHLGPAISAVAG